MVIWLGGMLLTDSRETRETAHQVLWPQSDRMKHNETWHRPNTNYHLPVIHLGDYRHPSVAVDESWFFFQLESARRPKSHCTFFKCKIAVHQASEFMMQNESDNKWALVNTKHAIEESSSCTWHSWRQVFTVNSITRCNDTGAARAASTRV